jgi:nitrile hydratase
MNGIHDLGGMHGFGPVETDGHDELFHEDWEALAFAMQVVTIHGGNRYTLNEFRRAREQVSPEEYLTSPYYDTWLAAVERMLVEKDVVDADALLERIERFEAGEAEDPTPASGERTDELAARTLDRIHNRVDQRHDVDPRFDPGDEVVVRNDHPEGHTRVPRYVRRCRGVVERCHGGFVLPDADAHGEERVEQLYTVRFDAEELWDGYSDGTDVHIDLWESYVAAPGAER